MSLERNNRVLIVDDNESIHDDFRKVLGGGASDSAIASVEQLLFGDTNSAAPEFALTMASQGEQAVELAREAMAGGRPFAVVFLDIRMPPGIDGIETARCLWEIDPELQVVICSAYSDYSWTDMTGRLGAAERWVLLKKPFENIEVLQLAASLVEKRGLQRLANARRADLEASVALRTEELRGALSRLERETADRLRTEEERRALERKLEQAQRVESLGVLAGGIAHDFNNILTGVLGRATLARGLVVSGSDLERHLGAIELAARRAAELCEQMLAYAGRGSIAAREIDVNELVREIRGLVEAAVPRDAEFALELARGRPVVHGDPARLRQVVMNLVINAAEALDAAPRRLQLATAWRRLAADDIARLAFPGGAEPGEMVVIQVSDTGVGMTRETLQRIFEPFFTTKFEGRGLGLSAVHGIVRNLGGAMDVDSAPGRGTVFRVFLPIAASAHSQPAGEDREPVENAAGARLLVVDDEECVREVVSLTLRRHGYHVAVANDGLEGVEHVRRDANAFDAVVLDMTMPRMGGIAALEAMRALCPGLPAVLISGQGQPGVAADANGDLTVSLQKPFEMSDLCASVATVLKAAGGRLERSVQ